MDGLQGGLLREQLAISLLRETVGNLILLLVPPDLCLLLSFT